MAFAILSKNKLDVFVALLLCCSICESPALAMPPQQLTTSPTGQVQLTVMDQNGLPLEQAFVIVQQNNKTVAQERSSPTGIATLRQLAPGKYKLMVEKQGFYTSVVPELVVVSAQTSPVEVRLQPVREYKEEIEVTAQASPIDPDETASAQAITASDISNIPYPSTRDYRNVLPYIPGVLGDQTQIHIAGASTQEIQDYLDGFEVSQPASGALSLRVNPDSLRKIDVHSSRYSAEFGKGSGGLVDLQLQDGDNKFRVNATDLIPTFQNVKGFQISNWTPRGYFSGPLVRDKIWFDLSHEGENDYSVVKQLPNGADTNRVWRIDDLGRLRMNLTPGNVLTASALLNLQDSQNTGISPFDPVSVSLHNHNYLYILGLKDQITIAGSTMLEVGAGFHRNKGSSIPVGDLPYVLAPSGRSGNYFVTNNNISTRTQAFANLFLHPWKWMGTHQFTVGGRADRVIFDSQIHRGPVQFVDASGAILRQIAFSNTPGFGLSTVESSAFLQDRWTLFQRMIIEPGARWDHD
ncbi:MAG TPA: carboxypeptidase regulatory-like domain-containing protein, partial [Candidatus Angelobacter sp.]|nr:carboxypeptidase regulatory-like domain-containing protein [Candidatus Angelobacter sp.]